ncbi:MAG: hypothetical protein IJN64_07595 [Lachnospiraceae bacterium]|nr:hypothetical protein [Lachnospiraceae bacterium]
MAENNKLKILYILDIMKKTDENHNLGWYMIDQDFEDFELKILADSVAAARFLTLEDSNKLIRKIKKLATKDGESIIKLTTNVDEAIKIADAKFKIKYDTIMRAIAEHKQIRFQYYELSAGNKKVLEEPVKPMKEVEELKK